MLKQAGGQDLSTVDSRSRVNEINILRSDIYRGFTIFRALDGIIDDQSGFDHCAVTIAPSGSVAK